MNYAITIIIPIYNAEKYLKRTVESIINQSIGFENIELILVDDLSNDGSRKIMEEYSAQYSNIISVFSDVNHGFPGFARNVGIQKSTGKYIMFADNDDEYVKDYCEVMYNLIESNNVDVVTANYFVKKKSGIVKIDKHSFMCNRLNIFDNPLFIELDCYKYLNGVEVWTKIFKSSIIKENNIKFIEKGLSEDTLFLIEYYYYAKNMMYTGHYGYIWYRDGENLSHYSVKSTVLFIESYFKVCNLYQSLYEDDWDCVREFKGSIEGSLVRIILATDDDEERLMMLKKLYEFEVFIDFHDSLAGKWATILNKFLLRKKFNTVIFLMKILKKGWKISTFIK